jgi:hypothetical protein
MSNEKKATTYLAVMIPSSGDPYELEVRSDEAGKITHEGRTWVITPGSTWKSKSQRRIILPESAAESLTGRLLEGKTYLNCRMFFLFVKMALLEQFMKLQNQKPWFKQSSTWIIASGLFLICLILAWLVVSTNNGFESLNGVIDGLREALGNQASGNNQGHNDIAPRV